MRRAAPDICRPPPAAGHSARRELLVTRLFLLTVTRADARSESGPPQGATTVPVPRRPAAPGGPAGARPSARRRRPSGARTDPSGNSRNHGLSRSRTRRDQCANRRGWARYGPLPGRVQRTGRAAARTPCDAFGPSGAVSDRGRERPLRERRPGPLLWGVAAPAVPRFRPARPSSGPFPYRARCASALKSCQDMAGVRGSHVFWASAASGSRMPAATCSVVCESARSHQIAKRAPGTRSGPV